MVISLGIAKTAYLETLITHETGMSVELKSLTGTAAEIFERLHPRGKAGTKVGGQFVKKLQGVVGEAVHNVINTIPTKRVSHGIFREFSERLIPGITALEKLVDRVVEVVHQSKIKPKHLTSISKTLSVIYKKTGMKKLNGIMIRATSVEKGEYLHESSQMFPISRELHIAPSFPFEDLNGKIKYFEQKLARSQTTLKLKAKDLKNPLVMPNMTVAETKKYIMDDILRNQVEVQEYLSHIKNLKEGKFVRAHSVFNIKDKYEALTYHEMGHQWHDDYRREIDEHFGYRHFSSLKTLMEQNKPLLEKYGVTDRAKDGWSECIAENFTLYMAGLKKHLHPDMVRLFDKYIKGQLWK